MDIYSIYEALWRRAESDGVWVHYDGFTGHGMAGYFHAREDDKRNPMIALTRPYYVEMDEPSMVSNAPPPLAQPDLEQELITLAHEYGHFRSWKERTPRGDWIRYDKVARRRSEIEKGLADELPDGLTGAAANDWYRAELGRRLGADACAMILVEEQLAWTIGREALAELGYSEFAAFGERERRGLHLHRYRLNMEERWPDDDAGFGE